MAAHSRFSVIIPAYNEESLLPRTIAAIRESFASVGESSYEIIVCDNNSTDRTGQVAAESGAKVVFEPHNQISRARNAAAAQAEGEWLLFVDADTSLNPALLAATLKRISAGGLCGGGSTLRFDQAMVGSIPAALTWLWNKISVALNVAAGSYLFCLRDAWREVGGFDERVYAGEELYFSRRIKRWGRTRRLRFRILQDAPIVTSARKMEWYGQWELLRHIVLLLMPGALKRQESCGLWYSRPPDAITALPPPTAKR